MIRNTCTLITDLRNSLNDFVYNFVGIQFDLSSYRRCWDKVQIYAVKFNNIRKYLLKKYIYTINHKRIAINYFYFSMWTGLSGAALATMIRLELAHPGSPFFKGDSLRYLQVATAHGLIMVFFVVVPIIFGAFANFLIPYHVGSKDVAYPRLNSIGFWIQPVGFVLVSKIAFLRPQYWRYYDKTSYYFPLVEKSSYRKFNEFQDNNMFQYRALQRYVLDENTWFWKGKSQTNYSDYEIYSGTPLKLLFWKDMISYPESFWYAASRIVKSRRKKIYVSKCSNRTLTTAGWTFITPFSSNVKYTGIGSQDILILGVIFSGISSTISFTNLLITRRTLSMPGMRHRRILLPFVSIAIFLAFRMLALVTPVLTAAMVMMALDRHWQTTFFEFAYGGDPILSQHLFWFFGHPEVYILVIPTFGFVNQVIPYNNTRRVASKHHMIWAVYVMAYMGFLVWGHHMYLVGLDHRSRTMYSTITIMISMPATIKMVNWTLTLVNGAMKIDLPLLCVVSYLLLFTVAGFTGMWLSHVGLNISMHDTFYVVAHFHLMLSGTTMMGIFVGTYYYFTSLFGIKYSRIFGYLHLIYYSAGQWMTFLPMFYLGFSGMPRRVHDYPIVFMGWHSMATTGHFITMTGVMFFFFMFFDSHVEKRIAIPLVLGIPRWHKRLQYYLFKIRSLQFNQKKLYSLVNYGIRKVLVDSYDNEYETYAKTILN